MNSPTSNFPLSFGVPFRSIEISNPRFETEQLRQITVKSPALGHRADITVYVPPQAQEISNIPVVILLHGVYGSHWGWAFQGGAHNTAKRLLAAGEIPPMVIAMPSDGLWGDGSGYLPHLNQNFERWITHEVPAAVARVIPTVTASSPMFIGGLSMGGFGALRIAAKYPARFIAASGHSSATHVDQLKDYVADFPATSNTSPEDQSILETILRNRGHLPALRFDCGTEDPLIAHNRALHLALTNAGVSHTYTEYPGGHDWSYWEAHVADTFRFFALTLATAFSPKP